MKRIILFMLVAFLLTGCAVSVEPETETEATEPVVSEEPEVVLGFLDELEYSAEQIEDMRTILTNVGITEITELEIGAVSYGMQTIKGLVFTDGGLSQPKEVRVRINIENGAIYLVHIHCPSYVTSSQPMYLSGLTDRRADLYYDTEGGYLKKIDWESKAVVDY
ncbi:hypothetical protein [Succinimonas sp.]|uniref:hypothetical protein n=1 Tax=Succinimonas sp. TaxID=1936151 RepID=UPI0038652372